jgi:hypothetical protein
MKDKFVRIDPIFLQELRSIQEERIRMGTSKMDNVPSIRRLTKAIPKSSDWEKYKEKLIKAEIIDDRWK